jgi:hypothetical protein
VAAAPPATRPADAAQSQQACIAIVLPRVEGVEGNAADVGAAVREVFSSYLTGPSIRSVPLEARLVPQAIEEAQQKECTRVLIATVVRKQSSGGGLLGRVVGQAGSSLAWGIPGGSVGSAVVRGVAGAASQAMSDLASATRAKDEIRLEYRLQSVAGRIELGPNRDKAKARIDGEDLLTPLVEQASEAIAAVVTKP